MVCAGCRVKFAAGLCARFATERSWFGPSRVGQLQSLKRQSVSNCDVAPTQGQAEAATYKAQGAR
jgi:hypothetical protein